MAPGSPDEARSQAEIVQRRSLLAALEGVEDPPEVERRMVKGRPSEALVTAALDAELLVLGSRGHTTVHDVFVGSTSQRAIRHAACPVIVVFGRDAEQAAGRMRSTGAEEPAAR